MFKLKIKSRRYKGGGGSTETSSTIPEWAVPYLKNVGNSAEAGYKSGDLGNVAGKNSNMQTAFGDGAGAIADAANKGFGALGGQQDRLTALAGSGGYDTTALKDKAILEAGVRTAGLGNDFGQRGTLGSGRQAVMQGAQNAGTAAQFATIDQNAAQQNFQNKMTAEGAIGSNVAGTSGLATQAAQAFSNLGSQERSVDQEQIDAPWQALQRYASTIYGNPARQQTVASGGGK
jgi:hypothetical protein